MIIISQDKEDLINFDNVKMISVDENVIGVDVNLDEGDFYELGTYKSNKRAREVLKDIIKSYRAYRTAEVDGYTNVLEETAVFQMPEE